MALNTVNCDAEELSKTTTRVGLLVVINIVLLAFSILGRTHIPEVETYLSIEIILTSFAAFAILQLVLLNRIINFTQVSIPETRRT